jgi:hypothetical protein
LPAAEFGAAKELTPHNADAAMTAAQSHPEILLRMLADTGSRIVTGERCRSTAQDYFGAHHAPSWDSHFNKIIVSSAATVQMRHVDCRKLTTKVVA